MPLSNKYRSIHGNATACQSGEAPLFNVNASGTWNSKGSARLPAALVGNWGYTGNCDYGLDQITLQPRDELPASTIEQTLITSLVNISGYSTTINGKNLMGLIYRLVQTGVVDATAWSYTAGSIARQEEGSFVLGGFDESRRDPTNVLNVAKKLIDARNLSVALQSITDDSTQGGFLSSDIELAISSDMPQIWLPKDVCKQFEAAYGLQWDSNLNLYLLNDSQHNALIKKNATMYLQIAADVTSSKSINIELPYALMDLNISVNGIRRRYYPIHRTLSSEQYVLGRTFLQAAHLTVNYDNNTFQLSPARFPGSNAKPAIQSIRQKEARSPISAGAIAGIALGGVVLCIGLITAVLIRRKRSGAKDSSPPPDLLHPTFKPELSATPIEAPPAYRDRGLSYTTMASEIGAIDTMLMSEVNEMPEKRTPVTPVELEGSIIPRPELDAGYVGNEKPVVDGRSPDEVGPRPNETEEQIETKETTSSGGRGGTHIRSHYGTPHFEVDEIGPVSPIGDLGAESSIMSNVHPTL